MESCCLTLTTATKCPVDKVDLDVGIMRWDMDNVKVLSWLFQSMTPKIPKSVAYLDTAWKVWEILVRAYGRKKKYYPSILFKARD